MKPDLLPLLDADMREALATQRPAATAEPRRLPADPIAACAPATPRARVLERVRSSSSPSSDRTVDAGGPPTRSASTARARPPRCTLLVYLHGGGCVMGSLDTHDRIMRLLAQRRLAVLGIDYALAPETSSRARSPRSDAVPARPDPHLPAEAVGARRRFRRRASGAGPALALRDAGAHAFRPAPLLRRLWPARLALPPPLRRPVDGLDEASVAFFRDAYLPSPDAPVTIPATTFWRPTLPRLPPAFVTACALDPLLDDSRALAGLSQPPAAKPSSRSMAACCTASCISAGSCRRRC